MDNRDFNRVGKRRGVVRGLVAIWGYRDFV